jgi:hypothetical protein
MSSGEGAIPITRLGTTTMFDVYAFATSNSIKVPIALEELGLNYTPISWRSIQ